MRAVFLGAGASKAFGYPLTSELLPEIRRRLHGGMPLFPTPEESEKLDAHLRSLMAGFAEEANELPLITDVLSLIDYSLVNTQAPVPHLTRERLTEFRALLERAMLQVIDADDLYSPRQVEVLRRFLRWITGSPGPAVISTNYDLSLEQFWFDKYASHADVAADFDLGIQWRDPDHVRTYSPPSNPRFRLYKLHGSFNWLRCDLCEHIYVNTKGRIVDLPNQGPVTQWVTCECDHAPLRPVLVTPTLVRDVRDPNLLVLWQRALEVLRLADEWVLIGYSLPPEDIAIRSLLIRAYHGRKAKPGITVVQRGESARVPYKLFFPDCAYHSGGLEDFLAHALA